MAIRGLVLAKTGWTLDYINSLPELHLLFAYHYLVKEKEDYWDRMGSHLGTMWDRKDLQALVDKPGGAQTNNPKIFVPLSLVMNPELAKALLGKKTDTPSGNGGGDGLNTAMALPKGEEVVNMSELPKNEFFGLIANSGLSTAKS